MFRQAVSFPLKSSPVKVLWRGYAAPQTKQSKANKGNMAIGGDSRNEIIRRSLFDASLRRASEPTEVELEQDRVIQMAWDLYVKEKRDTHVNQGIVKYLRMVDASNELKAISQELFEATQQKKQSLLFPPQLKPPTETPGNTIWNYTSQTRLEAQAAAAEELKAQKKALKNK